VVDDNEAVGQLAEAMLGELGHQVVRVDGGAEAIRLARLQSFDAVFTDVVMPGMDGFELAQKLAEVLPDVPVVFTTGYSDEVAKSGIGERAILLKPYRLDDLAGALEEALRSSVARTGDLRVQS
jgi:CheY-like chemotaxis protein